MYYKGEVPKIKMQFVKYLKSTLMAWWIKKLRFFVIAARKTKPKHKAQVCDILLANEYAHREKLYFDILKILHMQRRSSI